MRAYLGFLYAGYTPESYYWEAIVMLRKLLIVTFAKLFVSNPQDLQKIMLSVGVIWISLLAQVLTPSLLTQSAAQVIHAPPR